MRTHHQLLGLGLLSAMTLTACSADDSPDGLRQDDRQIRFGASTEMTRYDITTNNLTSFQVYAYTGAATNPQIFMEDITVTKNATNVWTYSPVSYWPANQSVDFYAYAPAGWLGSATPVQSVPYDNWEGTEDIVYAVNPNMRGNSGSPNAQVHFNFRHALSKVTIKLSSTNTDLQVKVSNVALANIKTKGNFHFPGESTSGTLTPNTVGYWNDQNTPGVYLYHMSQTPGEVITLTSTPNDLNSTDRLRGGPRYLLPQHLEWNNGGVGSSDTYLTVMCCVYDADTGVKLWPNANTPPENVVDGSTFGDGLLRFPLSTTVFTDWQPGYHYIYNVVINSNTEMGAIEFGDPSVETYVDVETYYH